MSHELRTPLNGILGYTQILLRDETLTPKQRSGIDVIQHSGSHLLTLINDVLDIAKIEAQKLDLAPQDFCFTLLLNGVIELCRIKAEQKGVQFLYRSQGDIPTNLYADDRRLRQILLNLLSNAVKFTDRGSVTLIVEQVTYQAVAQISDQVKTSVTNRVIGEITNKIANKIVNRVKKKVADGVINEITNEVANEVINEVVSENAAVPKAQLAYRLRFTIEDTGSGIAPEALEQIFLPFEQVGDQAQRIEGTGLGLTITQRLVELMGGKLQVESVPQQGSRFWFELTLAAATRSIARSSLRPKVIGYEGKRRSILVIDDRPDNRAVVIGLLKPLGFQMLEAADGQAGLAQATLHSPDLLIVDLVMPGMNGFDLIRQVRQHPNLAHTPALASSASVFEFDRQTSWQAGFNDFLPKPVQVDVLIQLLQVSLNLVWICDNEEKKLEGKTSEEGKTPTLSDCLHPHLPDSHLPDSHLPDSHLPDSHLPDSHLPDSYTQAIVMPPAPELQALYEAVQIGHIAGITQEAFRLRQLDSRFESFTSAVIQLAEQFDDTAIEQLIASLSDHSLSDRSLSQSLNVITSSPPRDINLPL